MFFKVGGGGDHGKAARRPQRHSDHVTWHQVGGSDSQIEPFGDDIDYPAFGDEIDVNLWVALQERQN